MPYIPALYQLFVGRWETASLKTHKGKVFHQLIRHNYQNLLSHGIDWLYLTGLFDTRSPHLVQIENGQDISSKPDRMPSAFAIVDHTLPHPYFGKTRDFLFLLRVLHKQGLKVMVDFVPNHTNLFHPWVRLHPEYYVHHDGQMVREFSGDVVKLNYDNPATVQAMIEVMSYLADWGVDGFRVDMAHLVPDSFWQRAIAEIKTNHPEMVFVAEAYAESVFDQHLIPNMVNNGFDYIYHEPLYRNLKQVFEQQRPISDVAGHLNHIFSQPYKDNVVNYFSNHDDVIPSSNPALITGLLALISFLPGSLMIYNGSLHGRSARLAHHYYEELPLSEYELNRILPDHSGLLSLRHKGYRAISAEGVTDRVLAMQLKGQDGQAVVWINFADTPYRLKETGHSIISAQEVREIPPFSVAVVG